jgi:energy-coupling factor transporter transmembrane protein EcfT
MKNTVNFFIICIFWISIYFLLSFVLSFVSIQSIHFLFGIIASLFIVSLIYKTKWYKKFISTKSGVIGIVTLLVLFSFFMGYSRSICKRSHELYIYLVSDNIRGRAGKSHVPDSIYGFKPLKNARAFDVFPIGDPIPTAYDMDGFRVPLKDSLKVNLKDSVDIIFLGCSFTFGDACYADSTFAHLVAQEMGFSYINAGVCSYGLSHMYLLSKELIAKYKPRYIVYQYSDWLLGRALSAYAPVYFGTLPIPYFVKKEKDFELFMPVFQTQIFEIDAKEIKNNFKNKFFSFLLNKGLPFFIREDINKFAVKMSVLTGKIEMPTNTFENQNELTKQIYAELISLAIENNSQPIILNLGNQKSFNDLDSSIVNSFKGALLADAVHDHNTYLVEHPNLDYLKAFVHWRINNKGDSVQVDGHPNNLSHKIIAKTIIKTIKK